MCCSAWPAVFRHTITGTCEVLVDEKIHHVTWYQNEVGDDDGGLPDEASSLFEEYVNRIVTTGRELTELALKLVGYGVSTQHVFDEADRRKRGEHSRSLQERMGVNGNCLIIPLLGSWESIRLLNTADTPALLSDIAKALALPEPPAAASAEPMEALATWGRSGGRMVFLQFDVYDIVIAESASDIGGSLEQINPAKRPSINNAVFEVLEDWYRSPVALCCFNSTERAKAKPIAFAFEPTDPEHLVVYTLDGHDGSPPDPHGAVTLEHTVFVGSYLTPTKFAAQVPYTDEIPDHLRPYVLESVMGMPVNQHMWNGDFVFETEAVRQGIFAGVRQLPRFALERNETEFPLVRRSAYINGSQSRSETEIPAP